MDGKQEKPAALRRLFSLRVCKFINLKKFLYTNGNSCAILYRVDVPAALMGTWDGVALALIQSLSLVFFRRGTRFPAGQII